MVYFVAVQNISRNKMNEEMWQKYIDIVMKDQKVESHEPNYGIIETFSQYIPKEIYSNILEIAAGAGVDMALLRDKGYTVEGIDLHRLNIAYALEHFGLHIKQQDMHELKFPSCSFDGILSIQTFEHALSPFIAASEMCRVLKYKGRIFLDTCDPNDDAMWGMCHPMILYPRQIIKLFERLKVNLVADLSREHRTQIVFEKGI